MKIHFKKAVAGRVLFVIAILLLQVVVNPRVMAIANPAALYCEALGYTYIVESTPQGERGLCQLPSGEKVSAWDFLKGKVGQECSYCQQKGYQIKTVRDPEICAKFGIEECAVCVLEDGKEVEVTELMELELSNPGCFRVPVTIIIVVAAVLAVALILAVVLFMRRRARLAPKSKA